MTVTERELEMAVPVPVPTADDPFALGWRYRDGGLVELPLTPEDLLWQEEGDQIVTNHGHVEDMRYLAHTLRVRTQRKPGVRVLSDHCIDFQVEGLGILGPGVILMNGEPREWDAGKGTFPVREMAARPLYAFEITSPSTRQRDFRERLDQYYRAGVPVYVVIDAPYGGGKRPQGVVGFQAGPDGYERLPAGPDGRVWIEVAEVWLTIQDGRLTCILPDGYQLPDGAALLSELDFHRRAEGEQRQRADAEKARADETARKLAELEAELRRLRGA